MPHQKIRFVPNGSGGCDRVPPTTVGVKPDEHVYLIANRTVSVTLKFGPKLQKILTPRPPSELILAAGSSKNVGVRYDIVPDAYHRLDLDPNGDTPEDLDLTTSCVSSRGGHDIIMELC